MNLPQLNLAQLRTFVAAAEHASFIAAADAVHRSQAAVSMQIMKLEECIGQPLFIRHTRRIALTLAGETVFLCCSGCKGQATANPEQTAARVKELRSQSAGGTPR